MTLTEQRKAIYDFADDIVKRHQDQCGTWDAVDSDAVFEEVLDFYDKMPDKSEYLAGYTDELVCMFPFRFPSFKDC